MSQFLESILQPLVYMLLAGLHHPRYLWNLSPLSHKPPLMIKRPLELLRHVLLVVPHVEDVIFAHSRADFTLHTQFEGEIAVGTDGINDASRMVGVCVLSFGGQACYSMRIAYLKERNESVSLYYVMQKT